MNVIIKNKKSLCFFVALFLISGSLFAQGWERVITPPIDPAQGYGTASASSIFIENGGYMAYSSFNGERRFMHVNESGYQTSADVLTSTGSILIQNTDGDFVFARRISSTQSIGLVKVDPQGVPVWSYTFNDGDPFTNEAVSTLIQDSNGDYIVAGASGVSAGGFNYLANIYKVNDNGDVLWNTTYDHDHDIFSFRIVETADGGYLLAGSTEFSTTNQPYVTVVIKLNANGDVEWTDELPSPMKVLNVLVDNNSYLFSGRTATSGNSTQLLKTDASLNETWTKYWATGYLTSLIKTSDDHYAMMISLPDIMLSKIDAAGVTVWENVYGGTYDDIGYDIKQTADEGFIMAGYISYGDENTSLYLIKTDENGVAFTNVVEGYVQYDTNEDCINDAGEQGLEDWIVTAEGAAGIFYASADVNGYYSMEVDTGEFAITSHVPNAYWEPCVETEVIQMNMNFDTTQVDFAIQSIEQCPLMEVTMMAGSLRICEENTIHVNCQNQGTWIAEDAYVEITFDDSLDVLDASVNYTLISGNTYSFEIGDVDFLQETNFTVEVMVGCADELLGQTLCSEALIFPDTSCLPLDSLWTGASLELKAWCDGDDVKMSIKNIGTGTMLEALEYIVVEDDVIMNIGQPFGPLAAGDSLLIIENADGSFYRIESPQEPFHPGASMPSAFIEACGDNGNGEISLGFVNQYPLDDADYFIDLLCLEVVASFDPNIKTAFPEGYDTPHYIERNTDIDYTIHFQNTGTAQANIVILQDVISQHLDPATIRPGASSHPYDFELFSEGIIKFTFENIMLPDSTSDEAGSHGFVQFRISQKEGLPIGTEIRNQAAIFFDANAPVITNQTLHTIGENYITVDVGEIFRPDVAVHVFPNPFEEMTTFEVELDNPKPLNLLLFDAMGRMVRKEQFSDSKYQFYKKGLSAGIYFYSISDEDGILNSGKVIVK